MNWKNTSLLVSAAILTMLALVRPGAALAGGPCEDVYLDLRQGVGDADCDGNVHPSTVKAGETSTLYMVREAIIQRPREEWLPDPMGGAYNVYKAVNLNSCQLVLDGTNVGDMSLRADGSLGYDYAFPSSDHDSTHTVKALCRTDKGEPFESPGNAPLTVKNNLGSTGETVPPSVGRVTMSTTKPMANVPITYSVTATDNFGVARCVFVWDGKNLADMTSTTAGSYSYTYAYASGVTASHSVAARCYDSAGNSGVSSATSFTLYATQAEADLAQPPVSVSKSIAPAVALGLASGLVKQICLVGASADDVCRAVYFIDSNGIRHAFRNSNIFFSWYSDFSSVKEVTMDQLWSAQMGGPVPYHPGSYLIKFPSIPKTYEIDRDGLLRWVPSEAAANNLRGAQWNNSVVTESESNYLNYSFGPDISDSTTYRPADEAHAAPDLGSWYRTHQGK